MSFNYKQIYDKNQAKYEEMMNKYNDIVNSQEYQTAMYSTPFDFLRILYLAKRIDLYVNAKEGEKPVFKFSSVQEALSTYIDLIHFKENTTALLDKAALISQADMIADKINRFVKASDYLRDSLVIKREERINNIAKECLQVLPSAAREINSDLRIALLTDMCNTFNDKQITQLAIKKVFKKEDIDNLVKRVISEKGKANIKAICDVYGVLVVPIKTIDLRLSGTTFPNEDGTSRQENIKELEKYLKTADNPPVLTVEAFMFKPDIGAQEPAVRILWGDKGLGMLPRDAAILLHEEWSDKVLTAKVKNIVGGGQVFYGVEITLDICEKSKEKDIEAEREY